MEAPSRVIERFIEAFIEAWPTGDGARLAAFFSEDAVYRNGPLEPVCGRESIAAAFAGFTAMGGRVEVDMPHLLAGGPIVMTERVDHFIASDRKVSLEVMGIFEIHDGLITAWRDYFDLGQFASQMVAS